eukprot:33814-Pleurochrysis_carterae.AAC.1
MMPCHSSASTIIFTIHMSDHLKKYYSITFRLDDCSCLVSKCSRNCMPSGPRSAGHGRRRSRATDKGLQSAIKADRMNEVYPPEG